LEFRILWSSLLALWLVTVNGCPWDKFDLDLSGLDLRLPVFENPLVTAQESKPVAELNGSYFVGIERLSDTAAVSDEYKANSFLHIGPAGGKLPRGFMRAITVNVPVGEKGTTNSEASIFFVEKIADKRYIAHFPIVDGECFQDFDTWDPKACSGYFVLGIYHDHHSLTFKSLNIEKLDQFAESGKLTIRNTDEFKIITNKDLRELFRSNNLLDFGGDRYKRLGTSNAR